MAKFNSLGSNWTFVQTWNALTYQTNKLGKKSNQELYFYKGREALRAALRKLDLLPKSRVAITGFTCLAVYEAIIWEKLVPVLIDVDETLNLDFNKLKTKIQQGKIEAVIIQNTFGFTVRQMSELQMLLKRNRIPLIEDNAHSFGAEYDNGKKVGEVGALAIFSASQDKALDSVAGGILVINDKRLQKKAEKIATTPVPMKQQLKDRFYPFLTWTVRQTYDWGVGKGLHFLYKKASWLSQPMAYEKEGGFQELPAWQIELLKARMKVANQAKKARQKRIYWYRENLLSENLFWQMTDEEIDRCAALRMPVKVKAEKRDQILQVLKKRGYHLRDFWYDSPIGPKKYVQQKGYKINLAQLKRATLVGKTIINLPTHLRISETDVKKIATIIRDNN